MRRLGFRLRRRPVAPTLCPIPWPLGPVPYGLTLPATVYSCRLPPGHEPPCVDWSGVTA